MTHVTSKRSTDMESNLKYERFGSNIDLDVSTELLSSSNSIGTSVDPSNTLTKPLRLFREDLALTFFCTIHGMNCKTST